MTSPFGMLYLAIQAQLAAVTINDAPAFNFVEQDLGQLENPTGPDKYPVAFPCALIDIEDSIYENMGENAQSGVVNICIRLGFNPYSATEANTPAPYRNKALYYYDLEYFTI